MIKNILCIFLGLIFLSGCDKGNNDIDPPTCEDNNSLNVITQRNFEMGFSTWGFGPNETDKEETYQFIELNADIYSEQIDDKIPWAAWMNNSTLPTEFTDEIDNRVSERLNNHKLVLSVSLLNTDRSDLLEDYDGTIPNYASLNDTNIENAYFKHLDFLIFKFNPDYLVIAMEVNELKLHSGPKWTEYKLLMNNIRGKLKIAYPNLPLSESITLHNWFNPEVANPTDFIFEISNYVNQNYEFIIWWAYRDYDKLWETFPPEYKDVGKLWRDTGLLDENGTERPSLTTWKEILEK